MTANLLRTLPVLALAVLLGCASAPQPLPRELDPSRPDAPESPLPALSSTLGSEEPAPEPPHENVVYVCPMHPEVQSNTPDTCPKCRMRLVPRKTEPAHHDGAPP